MNLSTWSALIGILAPALISVIQQPRWPGWIQALVTLVFCVTASVVTAYLQGKLSTTDVAGSFLAVLVLSQFTYTHFWKPSGVSGTIETLTSPKAKEDV